MDRHYATMENELLEFSQSLIPSIEDVEEGRRYATNLFELLKRNSQFRIDRVGIFGSVRKQTSIKIDFDFDCVLFINDELPPFNSIIDDFEGILLWKNYNIISKYRNTIQVRINNIKFDVAPAINFSQDPDEQRELVMEEISSLPNPSTDGYRYSSSLCETQANFINNQSQFVHNFIRLAKFWNKTLFISGYIRGQSYLIEVIALYVATKQENRYHNVSILKTFQRFLKMMINLDNMRIIFTECKVWNHQGARFPPDYILQQRPLVLDPTNPFNNLAHFFVTNNAKKETF
ncbi:2'-5'-oligoadenylate synthase 1A-like [Centruroides vittatus]|uniref:2'-5'-oligoadenylate synthase 1A-like n=1 Tax=Centruroides vittatus TaxID=120091 RepID=UPI00350FD2DF